MYCDLAAVLVQQAEYSRAVVLYQAALEKHPASVPRPLWPRTSVRADRQVQTTPSSTGGKVRP